MEPEDCCKGGKRDKDCKAFGKEHKDKPLAEKLALISTVEYMMAPRLNDDYRRNHRFAGEIPLFFQKSYRGFFAGGLLRCFSILVESEQRQYIENAPEHIKSVFIGTHGDCSCNPKKENCRMRKTYAIDGDLIEKCSGVVFEFHQPNIARYNSR